MVCKEVTCQGFIQVVDRSRETVPRSERGCESGRGQEGGGDEVWRVAWMAARATRQEGLSA